MYFLIPTQLNALTLQHFTLCTGSKSVLCSESCSEWIDICIHLPRSSAVVSCWARVFCSPAVPYMVCVACKEQTSSENTPNPWLIPTQAHYAASTPSLSLLLACSRSVGKWCNLKLMVWLPSLSKFKTMCFKGLVIRVITINLFSAEIWLEVYNRWGVLLAKIPYSPCLRQSNYLFFKLHDSDPD